MTLHTTKAHSTSVPLVISYEFGYAECYELGYAKRYDMIALKSVAEGNS